MSILRRLHGTCPLAARRFGEHAHSLLGPRDTTALCPSLALRAGHAPRSCLTSRGTCPFFDPLSEHKGVLPIIHDQGWTCSTVVPDQPAGHARRLCLTSRGTCPFFDPLSEHKGVLPTVHDQGWTCSTVTCPTVTGSMWKPSASSKASSSTRPKFAGSCAKRPRNRPETPSSVGSSPGLAEPP